ncbi:Pyridine nucleotide-disulfide oxidoreductase; NADH dehydrogenase (EC [Olavius algarvensis associated proteobacterium Delta 3]|nr:Pyridine nucleotide-disulfide oxidoreductase; NADH dehydrogenase (EC [Olavius algarvensis associated proteobacterium Delta 3]
MNLLIIGGSDAGISAALRASELKLSASVTVVVARTGLGKKEAENAGFDPITTSLDTWDHKAYYPNARPMAIRIIGDRPTGRCLGAQILGRYGTEVSKRIDIIATAIYHHMTVPDLVHLPELHAAAEQPMRSRANVRSGVDP